MKLYLLEQSDNNTYDTYDSCLVCAENEADARTIDPDGDEFKEKVFRGYWAFNKDAITCQEIGTANDHQQRGVIIASYNAG
jgi:hypothetical protein